MIVILQAYHVIDEKIENQELQIDEHTSLHRLLKQAGLELADVSHYYPLSGRFVYNWSRVPYVLTDEGIDYDVPYSSVLVLDFLKTHNIDNHVICCNTGIPQCGGIDFQQIQDIWDLIINPVINYAALYCALSGHSVPEIIRNMKTKIGKKLSPHGANDLVNHYSECNAEEFGNLVGLETKTAEGWLELCGYQYDEEKNMYVPGEHIEEIRDEFRKVDVEKHE